MKPLAITIIVLFALVLAAPASAGGPPADLLARAESAFDRAEELLPTDPATARAALDESIAAYKGLVELGISNAAIHRNIGNAWMLRGDTGRALAAFRRAERIDPTDHRVRDSLAAARAAVRTDVSPGARSRVESTILFWRGWIPRGTLLTVGLAAWSIAWLAAALHLFTRRGGIIASAAAIAAVLTLGSLAAERALIHLEPHAVIVQDTAVGYRGPNDAVYERTFQEPIRTGVEARIIEQRDGWTRLRLRSGSETWVRTEAIERI